METPGPSLRTLPVLQASSGDQQERERVACQKPRLAGPAWRPGLLAWRTLRHFPCVEQPILRPKLPNRKSLITNGLCLNASFAGQAENRDVISAVESDDWFGGDEVRSRGRRLGELGTCKPKRTIGSDEREESAKMSQIAIPDASGL